jgi:hypothetical protein
MCDNKNPGQRQLQLCFMKKTMKKLYTVCVKQKKKKKKKN